MRTKKEKIKTILWRDNAIQELDKSIIEGVVAPAHYDEYLGKNIKPLEPAYLRTIAKMFSALLVNLFLDKVIDLVIAADDEIKKMEA